MTSAAVLTPAETSQLLALCTLAGSGDRAALAAAERRICRTVIVDSAPGLSGPAITAAEQSCARL
ncbi:MAG: hypothetical protein ABSH27_08465 [Solirubrobacteraceae bacterium]